MKALIDMSNFKKAVKTNRDDVILDLFVTPNTNSVTFPAGYNEWCERIEIKVCSSAKNNKANREIIEIIADFFNKSNREVSVVSGYKSREKNTSHKRHLCR